MNSGKISYKPVSGKTFSLFNRTESAAIYYKTISALADICLKKFSNENELLQSIQLLSRKKRQLKKIFLSDGDASIDSSILKLLYPQLHPYTLEVNDHLRNLSVLKRGFDSTLNMNEFQYHIQMLEVEIVNRMNKLSFRNSTRKFALLPHCLRDFTKKCKAEMDDLDYVCKLCSKDCFVRYASETLKKYDVKPYIWMTLNLKKLAHKLKVQKEDFAVLGIACFPELINGMRMCLKAGIPVVGIPLNANRCIRWTGSFLENSVDIEALDFLLGPRPVSDPIFNQTT
jgi:hypothetical protein